jgi:hypothetical protein
MLVAQIAAFPGVQKRKIKMVNFSHINNAKSLCDIALQVFFSA